MDIFTGDYGRDSGRATERSYRKVELQSPDDLTYLIAKLSRAAREKIDKHFPPDAALQGDHMKAQVEMLVDEYIRKTYSLAKPNLSINGMDSQELETELAKHDGEELEAFDSKLAYRIQDLSREIEENTLQLAELRRDAPAEIASRYQSALEQEEKNYQAQLEAVQKTHMSEAEPQLNLSDIPRIEQVKQTWGESNGQLAALKADMPSTASRIKQAQRAQNYMAAG